MASRSRSTKPGPVMVAGEVDAVAADTEVAVEVVDTEVAVEAMVAADTEVAVEVVDTEAVDMAAAVMEAVEEDMVGAVHTVEADMAAAVEVVDTEVADIEILYHVLLLFELVRLSHLYPIWSLLKTENLTCQPEAHDLTLSMMCGF